MAKSLAEKLWPYVNKSGPIMRPSLGPCWVWTRGLEKAGYGIVLVEGRRVLTHRAAFLLAHGRWPTPGGLHRCNNKSCCKASADDHGPAHVYEGNDRDNMADLARNRIERNRDAGIDFSNCITSARLRAKLTQAELGRRLGITQPALNQWETGKRRLDEPRLRRVATALGITFEELLRGLVL